MPYTSRDEIATAVQSAVQEKVTGGVDDTEYTCVLPARHYPPTFTIERNRITEEGIERYMMTNLAGSPPLDILVRTSGVKRLSDFLMWQVGVRFRTRPSDRCVTYGWFFRRRLKMSNFISVLRIGRILGFGIFSL